jgi:hypothetical protein
VAKSSFNFGYPKSPKYGGLGSSLPFPPPKYGSKIPFPPPTSSFFSGGPPIPPPKSGFNFSN